MAINISQINQGIEDPNKEKKISIRDILNNLSMRFGRVPLKEKLMFVQHLGVMLKAGISLSVALKTLSEQTGNKLFSKITKQLSENVEKGVSFADSLKPYQRIFGELFVNMIESGEISGKLESVLQQLFIQIKKQHELTSKVKGALTYPVVIILAMLGIGTFMMIVVMPKITEMLMSFNAELPLPTKILIKISDTVSNNGIIFGSALIVFIFLFLQALKTYRGKYYFQAVLLKLPIFSGIIKKINIAKFARTISSLLKTDIMIIKTFQITASVLGNLHYRKAVEEMSEKIKKGEQINEVIKKYPKLFPPVVVQMTLVGEQTGELDSILSELAEFYESEVSQMMDNLPAIIEPLLILILGVGVGAIAVAIIMPMYSLTSAI
jgi:type IV pilus assembly protein PilC